MKVRDRKKVTLKKEDMGTRVFLQLWRVETAYLNRTQAHDVAFDLSTINPEALLHDRNDPRCVTLSFSHADASPNPKLPSDPTSRVSHTIGNK